MKYFKDFLHLIREKTFGDPYIIFFEDVLPILCDYVQKLSAIKFEDESYHLYYGEVRYIINAFLTFFENTIDNIIIKADRCCNKIEKEELKKIIQETIHTQHDRLLFFSKSILPIRNPKEKENYEELEPTFELFKEEMDQLNEQIDKLNKHDKVLEFAHEHFVITVNKIHDLFLFTQKFMSLMLMERLKEIKISLEEILLRIKNNWKQLQEECENYLKGLQNELYEKNKEVLRMSRRIHKSSAALAEIAFSIKSIRDEIKDHKYSYPIRRVEEELRFWQIRLQDFNFIADNLIRLREEQENVRKQKDIYSKLRTTELPGTKKQCWLNMGESFLNREAFVQEKIEEVSKSLMTFFAVPGHDHIMYWDHIGQFYLDPYNHQVYVFNHELDFFHVTCDGGFKKISENDKYYFDPNGRYILDKYGGKIYQSAPCLSQYKLGRNCFLTKDDDYSDGGNREFRLQIRGAENYPPILPHAEIKNVKDTLSSETVKYLWSSFGHVLPEALHDIARDRPFNPIQSLAYKLLKHKYSRTHSELWKMKKEADDYRSGIRKKREEEAIRGRQFIKAKQVKRRKPEESDDTEERFAYDTYFAAQEQKYLFNDDM